MRYCSDFGLMPDFAILVQYVCLQIWGVIFGNSSLNVRLYFPRAYPNLFSQWFARYGIPFLSRTRKPALPSIIGSTFHFLRFLISFWKHWYTPSLIGKILSPYVVLVSSIRYTPSLVLCNWWSIFIFLFSISISSRVRPQNSEILMPVLKRIYIPS